MKTATITEVKNGLSSLIDRVRAGDSILVLDRGIPVARLEPIAPHPDSTGRIRRLERAGLIRRGNARPPLDVIRTPPPGQSGDVGAVEALLEERRTGR